MPLLRYQKWKKVSLGITKKVKDQNIEGEWVLGMGCWYIHLGNYTFKWFHWGSYSGSMKISIGARNSPSKFSNTTGFPHAMFDLEDNGVVLIIFYWDDSVTTKVHIYLFQDLTHMLEI